MFEIQRKREQERLSMSELRKKREQHKDSKISDTKSNEKVVTVLFMLFDGQVVRGKCSVDTPL